MEGSRPKVLLADDGFDQRMIASVLLRGSAWSVVVVNDGSEAVDRFRAEAYAAVLLDVHMPVLDGPGAAKRIREIEESEGRTHTPLVGLSAMAPGQAQADLSAFDEVLPKPLERAKLLDCLERVVKAGRA